MTSLLNDMLGDMILLLNDMLGDMISLLNDVLGDMIFIYFIYLSFHVTTNVEANAGTKEA